MQTNQIATNTSTTELLGNPIIEAVGNKCITKTRLINNWSVDESKLNAYSLNQLVKYQDIYKPAILEWSNTFATNFVDNLGNSPTTIKSIIIENAAAKLAVTTNYPIMIYNAGDLFSTCTLSTLELDVFCTTSNSNHGHLFCIEDTWADNQSVIGFSVWINQNASSAQERNRPLVIGGIHNSTKLSINEWHHVKLTYNWNTSESQAWLDNVSLGTRINSRIARTNKILKFGYSGGDTFLGYIKNVKITTE